MASRETQAIIDFVKAAGIPHRVTGIVGTWKSVDNPCSPHTAKSLHCAEGTSGKGLAVDFGGSVPGVTAVTVAEMAVIWHLFEPQAPKLKELFFNGPGITRVVKNGLWRDGLATLGPTTWTAHKNHLHVAVGKGTFFTPSVPPVLLEVRPMWDPPLHVVDFLPYWSGSGGYMLFADGGVGHVGDAPEKKYPDGRIAQPFGNEYWVGRKPARIQRLGENGFVVTATSGERYEFP